MKIVRTGALAVLVIAAPLAPAHLSAQEQAADSLEVIPLVPLTVTVLRTPVRMDQAPFTVAALRRDAAERAPRAGARRGVAWRRGRAGGQSVQRRAGRTALDPRLWCPG